MSEPIEERILRALRRITRAIDIHSRKLTSVYGLTGPQLVCLRSLGQLGPSTPGTLARAVSLSQGTITGIVDRLEARQLVTRDRDRRDRRRVSVAITEAGRRLIAQAPSPLQERFLTRLAELSALDQERICDTLDLIVSMMDSDKLKAAPVLSTSSTARSAEEVQDMLDRPTHAVDSVAPLVKPEAPEADPEQS